MPQGISLRPIDIRRRVGVPSGPFGGRFHEDFRLWVNRALTHRLCARQSPLFNHGDGSIGVSGRTLSGGEIFKVEAKLNEDDIARLMSNPSADTRAELAGKIASQHVDLSPSERAMAEDIFRLMAKDAEVRVRKALAYQLKENSQIPHDLALVLAKDVAEVSLPMLEFSDVLTSGDLLAIIRGEDADKQVAVAKRASLPEPLANALVDTHNEKVAEALAGNPTATLSEAVLSRVVQEYGEMDSVGKKLLERGSLPVSITEQLMSKVSEQLRVALMARDDLSPEMATALLLNTRELAVLGLSEVETDAVRLTEHLHRSGRLTASIVLRSVCMGDLAFFEAAMATMARIKPENARVLIDDLSGRGFEALFEKVSLPRAFFTPMKVAISISREMAYDGGEHDRERFSRKAIERMLTHYGDLGVSLEATDLEYLLSYMNKLPAGGQNTPE